MITKFFGSVWQMETGLGVGRVFDTNKFFIGLLVEVKEHPLNKLNTDFKNVCIVSQKINKSKFRFFK